MKGHKLQLSRQSNRIHTIAYSSAALLRLFNPETAHNLGLWALKSGLGDMLPRPHQPSLSPFRRRETSLGPLIHPIGLAAGFDKSCEALNGLQNLGFSFLEVGSVTPLAQSGNPKPRIFRYPHERSILNRMGFNNDGMLTIKKRLIRQKAKLKIPVGVNVGKNRQTELGKAIEDYISVVQCFSDVADYFVINISSPNTAGLRDLASKEFIAELAASLKGLLGGELSKFFIKLDPDMTKLDFQSIISAIAESGFNGVCLTNTHKVSQPEVGGLSGQPLSIRSTQFLEWAHEVHKGQLAMIGSGGVMTGADILQKMMRGAEVVQIYTGFIYRGPFAVYELLDELQREMHLLGVDHISQVVGLHYLSKH